MTPSDLAKLLKKPSNSSSRIELMVGRKPIFPDLDFNILTKEAKRYLAQYFLLESCSGIGGGGTNGDLLYYLMYFAEELDAAPYEEPFGSRFKEHIVYAVKMIAQSRTTDPPAAIASVFILTRLEILFRVLSGVLKPDGSWIDSTAQANIASVLKDKRVNNKRGRINDVALTYKILMLNKSSNIALALHEVDIKIPPFTVMGSDGNLKTISDIGERIGYMRQPIAHGFFSDPSSEGWFYALLIAIIYFSL